VDVAPEDVFQPRRGPEAPAAPPRSLRSHLGEFLAISFAVVAGLLAAAAAVLAWLAA
jgi:hypothetical protein